MTEYDYSESVYLNRSPYPAPSRAPNETKLLFRAQRVSSPITTDGPINTKARDGLLNRVSKLLKLSRKTRKRLTPISNLARDTGNHSDIERGRSRVQKHLAASTPNLRISHRSISPQLLKFPPPSPFPRFTKPISDGNQEQREFNQQERRRQRQLRRQEREKIRQDLWARRQMEDEKRDSEGDSAFKILHSRPILSNRLSERNLSTSRVHLRSRNSSVQGMPEGSSKTNKSGLVPDLSSPSLKTKGLPVKPRQRLSKPLPLPPVGRFTVIDPYVHCGEFSSQRQRHSPQKSRFIRHPRRPSPHPSSGQRSSRSSYSRSSSISSFGGLSSIPQGIPHQPSDCSRQSSPSIRSTSYSRSHSPSSMHSLSPHSAPLLHTTSSHNREDNHRRKIFKLRLLFKGHKFTFVVPSTIKYGHLVDRIRLKLRILELYNEGPLNIDVKDVEGNFTRIETTEDMQQIFQQHQQNSDFIELSITPA
ncbi:hypothetical protein JR316_0010112 [Psilocybe cubensis]|uniref:Uncharacterized protein n=2 Tax=Psilocybe cubensis TaxID=181762 RepID=A0ACB8GQ76_PSICU|nr:hypothetical protein JR316_0010112 [Psilocybe cubensis]KAH9477880.1 hypothetical protein JR316_0010112 [Psilocybe cubensis]